jgi:hypothetical protein
MSTQKKQKTIKQADHRALIPERFHHGAAILMLFISLIVFFNEIVFDSRVFIAADTIASKSFETLLNDANEEGVFPLWNPYIFCGMPGYASLMVHGERFFDMTAWLLNKASVAFGYLINNPDVGWGLFYYWVLGIGIYFLVFEKVRNKIAALVAGLAVMHSTFIIILVMVGHMTKVPVIAFFPFVFIVLERLREKFDLAHAIALVVLIHFMFLPSHFQIIFYCYFAIGLYYLFFLVRSLIKKESVAGIIRSGLIFAAATILAFAMTGDQYLSTLEYSDYSMRGADPIVPSQQAQEKGGTNGGLDYDYATQWSFSPGEMLTFVIPSTHGFGWYKYQGVLTQNQEIRLNTYFGNMPFTDAPQYMGIVILVLAGIGFWRNRKDPFVQYAALLISISLVISFGKELPLFYDLMFNYFPMFNKFRIPSMMLILVQIMVPILAGYGIVTLIKDIGEKNEKRLRVFRYSLFATGGLLIVSIAAKDLLLSIYGMFFSEQEIVQSLSRSYGTNQMVLTELHKTVLSMVAVDITVGLLLVTGVIAVFYLAWQHRINITLLAGALVLLVLGDLWRVNYKPMETQPYQLAKDQFATPDFVKFLQRDTTLFRTVEFEKGQAPYNNTLAYWRIQSIYGYSGTKMRQIQDVFDVVGIGNPLLWGLMNVRYVISDRPDSNQIVQPIFGSNGKFVLLNKMEMPRVFFVDRYQTATGLEILNNIKSMSFDPRNVAFVMEDPNIVIDVPKESASAAYTHFGLHEIELSVTATGNNLLFLSETWYPEGWKAYLDGNEIPILRLNYMFRGVVIPEGSHTVRMVFEPNGFYLGKNLSLALNIFVLAGVLFFSVRYVRAPKQ